MWKTYGKWHSGRWMMCKFWMENSAGLIGLEDGKPFLLHQRNFEYLNFLTVLFFQSYIFYIVGVKQWENFFPPSCLFSSPSM